MSHWPKCGGTVVKVDGRGSYCATCGCAISTVPKADRPPLSVTSPLATPVGCPNHHPDCKTDGRHGCTCGVWRHIGGGWP